MTKNLAVKYRPKTFEEVIEQDVVKSILKNQIKNDDIVQAYLFAGPSGDGKAQPLDSNVLTPNGYKKMRDIKINDAIIDGQGHKTYVQGVYPQGIKPVYRITFSDNTSVLCSDEHLWKVQEVNEENKEVTISINDSRWEVLSTKEILNSNKTYCIPVPLIQDMGEEDLFIKPYMFGCMIVNNIPTTKEIADKLKIAIDENGKFIKPYIPKEYLYSTQKNRFDLLQALLNNKLRKREFITPFKQLSEDFAFLIRSLGGMDIVTEENNIYKHCFKTFFDNPTRLIVNIEYIGEQECQCIYVSSSDHTYITDNVTVTHNTTTARIFANELDAEIIEVDAASNNGIDNIRDLIQQAQMQSITNKYKFIIMDECMTGDTEILTTEGFKRFDELNGNEIVAQYNDDGTIEFVKPDKFIKNPYTGNLKCWKPRNWCTVKMTPNHVQPLHYKISNVVKENYIKDCCFSSSNELIVSGKGIGDNTLTPIEKLKIASVAMGFNKSCSITLSNKQRKRKYLLQIFKECGLQYEEIKNNNTQFTYNFEIPFESSDKLKDHFTTMDFSYNKAREFIKEILNWNNNPNSSTTSYTDTKENVDFVSAVATLGGFLTECKYNNDKYTLYIQNKQYTGCQTINKTMYEEYYDGFVYCVVVPSHKIVVRSEGFTFITGNCHSLTNNGWQALLKILEEPPKNVLWCFCTTDPQKIPKTILSRVQRFNFKRVSKDGIAYRLKQVIEEENKNGTDIKYKTDAIDYIAKLADGHMRDALTTLNKCLAFDNKITIDRILYIMNLVDYNVYINFTNNLLNNNIEENIKIINQVYNDGVDLKDFINNYVNFLIDINKYQLVQNFDLISLPKTKEIVTFLEQAKNTKHILEVFLKVNNEVKVSTNPKCIIEATILVGI